jgi:tetratricopeptide (TPR) repeat protein
MTSGSVTHHRRFDPAFRALLVSAIVVAFGATAAGGARQAGVGPRWTPPRAPDTKPLGLIKVRQWVDAAAQHEPGVADDATLAFRTWSETDLLTALPRDLERLRKSLQQYWAERVARTGVPPVEYAGVKYPAAAVQDALGLSGDEARNGDVNRLLRRGALLHADIAMLRVGENTLLPSTGTSKAGGALMQRDGRLLSITDPSVHWEAGRRLLDAVRPAPAGDEFVRLWYHATTAYLQERFLLAALPMHVRRAIEIFPKDGDLTLDAGCLAETLAAPRVQNFARSQDWTAGVAPDVASEGTYLRQAADFFGRAREARPAHVETQVRYARILGLLGRHQEAAAALRSLPSAADSPKLDYFANLFLGDEEQALGRFEPARQAYERAAALFPRAQSPWLALSRMAWRRGDKGGGVAASRRLFELVPDNDNFDDPWWQYFQVHGVSSDVLLGDLRRPYSKTGGQ